MNDSFPYSEDLIKRRDFLRSAVIGGPAAAFGLSASLPFLFAESAAGKKSGLFERRPLGNTGLTVSSLGMGQSMEPSIYLHAIDKGMNLIETGRGYRGGAHEDLVGKVISRVKRENLVVLTKTGIIAGINSPSERYAAIIKSAEKSLRALKTNYIDVFLGYSIDDPNLLKDEQVKKAFAELKKSGKIRFCGVSTHKARPIFEYIVAESFYDVVLTGYNFAAPPEASKILEKARKAGIGIITMKTLLLNLKDRDAAIPSALRFVVSRKYVDSSVVIMPSFEILDNNLKTLQSAFTARDLQILRTNVLPSQTFF
jgi:aryl-alcohol dehydrogenase-like predicted oxidoreductase